MSWGVWGWRAEGEGEADSLPGREANMGLDLRTPRRQMLN